MVSKEDLQAKKIIELRKLCKENGLEGKGLKSALVDRLLAHYAKEPAASGKAKEAEAEEVDTEEIHTGCVANWKKGYGWIRVGATTIEKVAEGEEKPEEIFVHRDAIVAAEGEKLDCLRKGMCVQFKKGMGGKKNKDKKLQAKEVKNAEGEPISWFQQSGEGDREIFAGETYSGLIGKYSYDEEFGYLLPSEEIVAPDGTTIDLHYKLALKKLDFVKDENANLRAGRKVQFNLFKYGEKYGATKITKPDGEKIDKEEKVEWGKEEIDAEQRFTGRILSFSNNNFGFLVSHDDLVKFGGGSKVYFQAESINTDLSPVQIIPGMEVSFTIKKDKKNLSALNVSMPDGGKIVLPDGFEQKSYEEIMPRESFTELEFEGEVATYFWDKGYGLIKLNFKSNDVEVPEEVKKACKDDKIYFRWSDIKTADAIVGINRNQKVKCNLYKDARGYGAENVTDENGEAISGADRSKADKQRRKWGGRGRGRGGRRGRGWKRQGGWRQGGRQGGWSNNRRGGGNWGNRGWGGNKRFRRNQEVVSMYGIY